MNIIIGGDFAPTQSNMELFNNGDYNALLGEELLSFWNTADLRILNLETPIVDKKDPISKCGPNHIAPTSTIKGIKALSPSLFTLANNHILDQGIQGLKSTEDILNKFEIPFVGVGENLEDASKPFIFHRDGLKIGIYTCTEHEFSIATESTPGANPFDPLESLDHILALKAECNYVIVLYHGGKEYYRYPSPYLQRVCRKMAIKGADLVLCQHSHCIGCYEEYNGSTLVYGQGNFIFDGSNNEFEKTSLLVNVYIDDLMHVEYIPIMKSKEGIRIADKGVADNILAEFHERSNEILKSGFVKQSYHCFACDNNLFYIRSFAGFGKWLSRIDRRLFMGLLSKQKYNKKKLLIIRNFIECESHRELILAGQPIDQYKEY